MSPSRSRFCRWTTALIVSGSPASRTRRAARCLCACAPGEAGDRVAARRVGILQAELDVLEPGRGQRRHACGVEPDPRGDQIAVEPDLGGMADQGFEIAAGERLAAGKMHLQDAERRRLAQHPLPGSGVELGPGALERQRVRAIGAAQRAAMGQLGEQRQRRIDRCGTPEASFDAAPSCREVLQHRSTSAAITSRGASYCGSARRRSRRRRARRRPAAARDRLLVGQHSRSGTSTIQACRTSSKRNRMRGKAQHGRRRPAPIMLVGREQRRRAGSAQARHRRNGARRAAPTARRI